MVATTCQEHTDTIGLNDSASWCCRCGSLYLPDTGWIPPAELDPYGHRSAMLVLTAVFGAYVDADADDP